MATAIGKAQCVICDKEQSAVRCEGCLLVFCYNHLTVHRQELTQQLDEIEINCDVFRQTLNEETNDQQKHFLIKQIDKWEKDSIEKIQQTAKEGRQILHQHTDKHFKQLEINLTKLTDQLKQTRQENDFNENDLKHLQQKLTQLEKELDKPLNISIEKDFTSLINEVSVVVSSEQTNCYYIHMNTKWKKYGLTIGGGNERGNQFNQLSNPGGIYVDDDDQCIYITDFYNHRIVEWKYDAKVGKVVAGGNGNGNRMDQLNRPTDIIIDQKTDSFIICDCRNRRVVRWPRQNGTSGQTIIFDIDCYGLTMTNNGDLYVSDWKKNEVRRWKIGETNGTIVAGGNGKGEHLNQLDYPSYLFVDQDHSVYVSDNNNHRVMKWMKGAKEGIVVAGGNGQGNSLTQLFNPWGVIVDHLSNVYVGDSGNNRIMRFSAGSKEGRIIIGGTGQGQKLNQFNCIGGLSFDRQGNLYVSDCWNNRVQKFDIDYN